MFIKYWYKTYANILLLSIVNHAIGTALIQNHCISGNYHVNATLIVISYCSYCLQHITKSILQLPLYANKQQDLTIVYVCSGSSREVVDLLFPNCFTLDFSLQCEVIGEVLYDLGDYPNPYPPQNHSYFNILYCLQYITDLNWQQVKTFSLI